MYLHLIKNLIVSEKQNHIKILRGQLCMDAMPRPAVAAKRPKHSRLVSCMDKEQERRAVILGVEGVCTLASTNNDALSNQRHKRV